MRCESDERQGRYLAAIRPIAKGEVVLSSEAFACCPMDTQRQFVCAHCLKQADGYFTFNLSCTKCNEVFYCSEECQQAAVHPKHVCKLLRLLRKEGLEEVQQTQLILCALTALAIAEAPVDAATEASLMPLLTTHSSCDRENNTHTCGENLNKVSEQGHTRPEGTMFRRIAATVSKRLSRVLADSGCELPTTESCLQVMHQLEANGYGWWGPARQCVATAVFPLGSFFNHSCAANVGRLQRVVSAQKPQFDYYALRDIEPGEQASVFYSRPDIVTSQRQATLMKSYNFRCVCWRCSSTGTDVEQARETEFLSKVVCGDPECRGVVVPVAEQGLSICAACGVEYPFDHKYEDFLAEDRSTDAAELMSLNEIQRLCGTMPAECAGIKQGDD